METTSATKPFRGDENAAQGIAERGEGHAKPKFQRSIALDVVRELAPLLEPVCERLLVAGSLRRRKAEVGDIELVFIPRTEPFPVSLFEIGERSLADPLLEALVRDGVLEKRRNSAGAVAWGQWNKLARHVRTGVPIDFFAATAATWWNYVVCRTGPVSSNVAIATAAQRRGWKWNPYGEGFSRAIGLGREVHPIASEREVFEFDGLPYKEPWER